MKAIRVRVENGRITGDAPAVLPEGEVELCLAEPDDEMTDDERARLNEALSRGFESIKAGCNQRLTDPLLGIDDRPGR